MINDDKGIKNRFFGLYIAEKLVFHQRQEEKVEEKLVKSPIFIEKSKNSDFFT